MSKPRSACDCNNSDGRDPRGAAVEPDCHQPAASRPTDGNGQAIAGMTLGIISLPMCWTGLLALAVVVLSIVFSSIGIHHASHGAPHTGMAVAGLACGVVGGLGYLTLGIASAGVGFVV